jgi:hypothetical protein
MEGERARDLPAAAQPVPQHDTCVQQRGTDHGRVQHVGAENPAFGARAGQFGRGDRAGVDAAGPVVQQPAGAAADDALHRRHRSGGQGPDGCAGRRRRAARPAPGRCRAACPPAADRGTPRRPAPTNKRGLTRNLEYPGRPRAAPTLFLDDQDHDDQLRRCLTGTSMPLELRITGALIRLYGLPIIHIVHLTTDRFHQDEHGAYFTFDKNPVLLPPTLARLIEQQITSGRSGSALGPLSSNAPSELLLPGRPASRPRSPEALSGQLMKHDLSTIAARNTALFGMAGELPPIILSDLFGIHRNTATQWATRAEVPRWAAPRSRGYHGPGRHPV